MHLSVEAVRNVCIRIPLGMHLSVESATDNSTKRGIPRDAGFRIEYRFYRKMHSYGMLIHKIANHYMLIIFHSLGTWT